MLHKKQSISACLFGLYYNTVREYKNELHTRLQNFFLILSTFNFHNEIKKKVQFDCFNGLVLFSCD